MCVYKTLIGTNIRIASLLYYNHHQYHHYSHSLFYVTMAEDPIRMEMQQFGTAKKK